MKYAILCCLLGCALGGGVVLVVTRPSKNEPTPTASQPITTLKTVETVEQKKIKEAATAKLAGSWMSMLTTRDGKRYPQENYFNKDGTISARLPMGTETLQYSVLEMRSQGNETYFEIQFHFPNGTTGSPIKLGIKEDGDFKMMVWTVDQTTSKFMFYPDKERESGWGLLQGMCKNRNNN